MLDLYRREQPISFLGKKENEKKYMIVPLRLQESNSDQLVYALDVKLIRKVCMLKELGYKKA